MRSARFPLGALVLSVALLASCGQALAAANHPFLHAITETPAKTGFEDACGVAFNPAGSLYVSDYYHDQIVGSPGIVDESPGAGPCKLAFDPAGNLYVNNWHHNVVKYTEPFGAAEVIDDAQPTGLARDPATGDLYVAHRTYVSVYETPIKAGEEPVQTIGLDPGAAYYGIAISTANGDLYVPDAATDTVKVFDSSGAPLPEITGSATPQGHFVYLTDAEVAVDNNPASPSYGHLFVLDAVGHGSSEHPQAVLDEFNAQGAYRGQITGFTDAEPSGIAFEDATYNVYVTSGNSEGSAVFVYGPTAPAHTLKVAKSGSGAGLVSSSPVGINCGEACAAEYNEGQVVTLAAGPDAHSTFNGWSVSGAEPCPGTGSCTVLLSHNVEVTANFEEPTQQTLTVTTTGAGQGTIRSEPAAISCPGVCTEHFSQGRLVTLVATPAAHNRFLGWAGLACDESTAPTCQVTMSQAESLTAQFAPIPQLALAVTKTGSGQGTVISAPAGISCPGTCSAAFDEGSTLTLTAVAAPGASFAGFSGGGCSLLATCTVTINAATSLSAEFIPDSSPTEPATTQQAAPQAATITGPVSVDSPAPVHKKHHHRKHKRRHQKHHKHRRP